MNLLLLSHSKGAGTPHLAHALDAIAETVDARKRAFFVRFTGVTMA